MGEIEIIMPKLYEDMESVILVEWHKKEGDYVEEGEIVFSVETEKAVFDIEAESEGYLKKIIINNSSDVNVMDVVGILSSEKNGTME